MPFASSQTAHLVAGPTASGKSDYAIELAHSLGNAPIINADSMQLYRDLSILTARPSLDEQNNIPHYMLGNIDGATHYSVGQWLEAVKILLQTSLRDEKHIIFVGGTGLYFQCALKGIAPIPHVPFEYVQQLEAKWDEGEEEVQALIIRAKQVDPDFTTRLKVLDKQRIIRALCVFDISGKPLSYWQSQPHHNIILQDFTIKPHLLLPQREALYQRINERFEKMMEQGAEEEVNPLKSSLT